MESGSLQTVNCRFDHETGIGYVKLNRPDEMNSISDQLRADVVAAFDFLQERDEEDDGIAVRVVVLKGGGDRAFCAGGDIDGLTEKVPTEFRTQQPYDSIESFGAPVVAAIDGFCLGGGMELALACDFRLASENALFGQPEVDIGLIPGSGGTQRLARLLGPSTAKELCMTGKKLSASEAKDLGIIDRLYDAELFEDEVSSFAESIAEKPPLAIRGIKDAVNRAQETSLREGRLYERRIFQPLLEAEDFHRGVDTFGEDTTPEWRGQ
jgi:enoyl-CoA hydratase/carnithine racemase